MPSPRHLILINITFANGLPQYTYHLAANGDDAQKVSVAPGDQIGWFVRVQVASGWSKAPYTLAFVDASIVGTSLITVPTGGGSGFFTVQSISGRTKYTLAASGILPPSDPEIQVDPNGVMGMIGFTVTGVGHKVRWTQTGNTMEFSDGSGWNPFPQTGLAVSLGDHVQFFAVLTSPVDFEVDFPSNLNNNAWASPFDLLEYTFPTVVKGSTNEYTADLIVADGSDHKTTKFFFDAALKDGSLKSASYFFILS